MYAYITDLPTTKIKIDILKTSTINNEYTLKIAEEVKKNGIQNPIIVDEKLKCLLGTTRVRVAILLNIKTIKAIIFSTQEIKGYYRIKDYDELIKLSKLSNEEFFHSVIQPRKSVRRQ